MLIRTENSEYIARDIGDRYSGYPLSIKLKDLGVPESIVVYPNTKWRMVFDVINYYSNLSDIKEAYKKLSKIIELSVHPLNFGADIEQSEKLIADFNKRLAFDKLSIIEEEGNYYLMKVISSPQAEPRIKSLTEHISEAIAFFKNEFSLRQNIKGFEYEYCLSEVYSNGPELEYDNEYLLKKNTLNSLLNVGVITKYDEKFESNDNGIWLYAICKIDEDKLMGTNANGGFSKIDKVVHEHSHHFDNSIQEKPIDLNIKNEKTEKVNQVKLSDYFLSFDNETAKLSIGDFQSVSFPSYKNEHLVMQKMFSKRRDEPVDWEEVYEVMTGTKSTTIDKAEIEKQKKSVKDTVRAINIRVKEVCNTDSELLIWETKCVKRIY